MNTNLSPVLDILYEAETAQKEGCRRVCELLSLDPTSTLADILIENETQFGDRSFRTLLEKVGDIVGQHKVQRNITDGYFIDPKQGHGCDDFLRLKLLEVLGHSLKAHNCRPTAQCRFRADECKVEAETRDVQPGDNKSGQIDLLITRQCDDDRSDNDRNFAIIVENKINRAPNQPEQLQKYVARFRRAGFSDEQIFVFFLPLTDDLDPASDDLKAILEKVTYAKITFEKQIRAWLKVALEEWPANLDQRIREHLSYYGNLINHLINQRERDTMKANILKQIEQAEQNNSLPSWSQVESLRNSADELKQCLESVLRGKLLLKIRNILEQQGEDVWLCLEDESTKKIKVDSRDDEQFGVNVLLCVRADSAVSLCFGASPKDPFWIGYLRSGSKGEQKKIEPLVLSEAQEHLTGIVGKNDPYYAWGWRRGLTYDNCVANSPAIAEKLVEMRNSLVDKLKVAGVRSSKSQVESS